MTSFVTNPPVSRVYRVSASWIITEKVFLWCPYAAEFYGVYDTNPIQNSNEDALAPATKLLLLLFLETA